ncbi:hypothetical protein H5410_010665 [Solanum commersonii]|uniref:Ubiquinol oxidase n=1 Tax=Solanum commersonii TaxID=4109 RepID=A0A9J6AN25_SOLCO|nr:hypothetical protein H5410_010665 [Solanum commersonii]
MNQLLVRSVMRRLVSGGTCNRCISSVSAAAAVVFREVHKPNSESVVMMSSQRLRFSGQWWKVMCSTSEPPSKNSTTSSAVRKEDEKLSGDSVEKMEGEDKVALSSYWGVSRPKITKEDGSVWPWNCFMPWETYQSDLSIDLSKHHVPKTFLDKVAYWTVKLLRIPTDLFFKEKYDCHAMMLETVAGVPGMVGGMLLHLRSLRKFEQSGGWIKALLEEAENERMHLMTMVELVQPKWYERLLLAHRVVGYLEEEAIHSYTLYLNDIDRGEIENVPAPAIAIDYWRLPKDATLKDVITVIRADEAHHRDVNHFASDIHYQGKKLQEAAAPIGYH